MVDLLPKTGSERRRMEGMAESHRGNPAGSRLCNPEGGSVVDLHHEKVRGVTKGQR